MAVAILLLGSSAAWAQPAIDTTFNSSNSTNWLDAANWNNGIPTATALNPALDSGFVTANTTITVTSVNESVATGNQTATPYFGALTLGSNSTLQISAPTGSQFGYYQGAAGTIYFNNGSLAEFTSGSLNSDLGLNVLPGATATFRPGGSGMVRGALTGAGNSTLNISFGGDYQWRSTGTNFSGNLSFTSTSTTGRQIGPSNFSGTNIFGTGTTTFNDNTRFNSSVSGTTNNKLNSGSTLKFIGDAGSTTQGKIIMTANGNQTIANLIVESPGNLTGNASLMKTGSASASAFLTVNNMVTFQGTANTVQIDNLMTTPTGNSLVAGNLTFAGTGNWSVIGDGRIGLGNSATITTTNNASIANALAGTNGFTKAGNGALTLTGNLSALTGNVSVSAGDLLVAGTLTGMSVGDGAELTIGTAASATDVLTLGAGGLSLSSNSTINWTLGTTLSEYDTIVSSGALDLAGVSNIIINGTSLGYAPEIGDSFTLFNGTVTNFDPSKFILNLPTLAEGSWEIQQGSLQLVVVPEPAGFLLAGAGLAGLFFCWRRRSIG